MQNALYDTAREAFLDGSISWTSMTIRAALINTSKYTPSSQHKWLSDVASEAIVATSGPFDNKTVTNGVADADDVTFTAVTGSTCSAILVYRDTGTASTSRLIAWISTASGLPIVPSGRDIKIAWDSGDNKIFKL